MLDKNKDEGFDWLINRSFVLSAGCKYWLSVEAAMTFGISAGVALVLGFALSSLAAPHDAVAATNTARHGFVGH